MDKTRFCFEDDSVERYVKNCVIVGFKGYRYGSKVHLLKDFSVKIDEIVLVNIDGFNAKNISISAECGCCCSRAWFEIPEETFEKLKKLYKFTFQEIIMQKFASTSKIVETDDYSGEIVNNCDNVIIKIKYEDKDDEICIKLCGEHTGWYPPYINVKLTPHPFAFNKS